ncbi:MAG: hypothetical protein ACKV2V_19905 [Blastocatellia bacterium]
MNKRDCLFFPVTLALLLCVAVTACRSTGGPVQPAAQSAATAAQTAIGAETAEIKRPNIGFRTKRNLVEHYEKHGREFGAITQEEYLRQAQLLRDRPAGGDILEAVRGDGVTTRFDRATKTFLAFNDNWTIRTCFRPNDGEAYYKRQLKKSH